MATVRKLPSGKYNAQIRRKHHTPISKSFSSSKDAYKWVRDVESSMDKGTYNIDRSSAVSDTLGEALIRYRDEITPHKKGKDSELRRIAVWLKHPLAKRSLSSLKGKDFAKHRDDRLKEVSAGTIRLELALISHLYSIAIKEWNLPVTNPVSLIRKPQANNARTRRLEGDEEDRLLTACKASRNPLLYPIVVMAIETAMRLSELLSIKWNDIDLAKRTVHLKDTKNGTARTIPLSLRAMGILRTIAVIPNGRVFHSWSQRSSAMNGAWLTAVKKAGITGLRFHDLRHQATSRLFEKGLNVMEVSAITGHKSMQMLRRYTHISPNVLINKLDSCVTAVFL